MHIAFVASECVPYSKTGGLADVVGALPRALAALGHQVSVYLPRYRQTKLADPETVVRSITVPFDDKYRFCSVVTQGSSGGVRFYFVDYPDYFDREALYGTPAGDYPDNAERFALFSRAVLEASKVIGVPQIFHCHDWQSALVPVMLLFAGAAFDALPRLVRERRCGPLALSAVALVATSVAAWWPLPVGADERPRATAYYNLAVSLEQQGATAAAMSGYRAAIADQPDLEQARVNLGALLARGGSFAAAIAEERSALAVRPDDPVAHTVLANALFEIGQLDEAEVHYRAALRAEPNMVSARQGLSAVGMARRDVHK